MGEKEKFNVKNRINRRVAIYTFLKKARTYS